MVFSKHFNDFIADDGRIELQRASHQGQHLRIHLVGLGSLGFNLRGDQGVVLEGFVIAACGLKDDLTVAPLTQVFDQASYTLGAVGSGGVVLAI